MQYEWMKVGPWAQFYQNVVNWGHREQALNSLKVANDFVHHALARGMGFRQRLTLFMQRSFPSVLNLFMSDEAKSAMKFKRLQMNFETLVCYLMVNETLIEELPIYHDYKHINRQMNQLLDETIAEDLYFIHKESPEMFILLEHLL